MQRLFLRLLVRIFIVLVAVRLFWVRCIGGLVGSWRIVLSVARRFRAVFVIDWRLYGVSSSWSSLWSSVFARFSSSNGSARYAAAFAAYRLPHLMLCKKPFRQGVMEYGCGQCMPCRFNRRRVWTARLMLESYKHESSLFVTLTYSKENLPCDGSVSTRDARLFLKRLRRVIRPAKLRYFIVGEYGDVSQRPHYHAVLFGVPDWRVVKECWTLGFVHVGTFTAQSASYVVSYTTKAMTRNADARLGVRHPEFARMSLKPGIGADAMEDLARVLTTKQGVGSIVASGDVPGVFRADGMRPIGRYLKGKLRELVGMDEGCPEPILAMVAGELRESLMAPGGREARESKRKQDSVNAIGRVRISNSRKGI